MGVTAVEKAEYQEKYYRFVEMLAQGAYNMTKMAESLGVTTKCLYGWAKRSCFGSDLDKAKRDVLRLNIQQVLNVQKIKAVGTGDTQAAKFYVESETVSMNLSKKSEEETVSPDVLVSGVIEAMRTANDRSLK